MTDIIALHAELFAGLALAALILQALLAFYMAINLRVSAQERRVLHTELLALTMKLEGLTAHRREVMVKHYDRMLQTLTVRLPSSIAAHAGQAIFDTESRIISRLAELEPNLQSDGEAQQKMDELIQSMEGLERTLVALTSDAVTQVMNEGRRSLLDDRRFDEPGLAA